jgi:anti-anti-sigma factor
MTALELQIFEKDHICLVTLSGELDISTGGRFERELSRVEDSDAGTALVLDLRELTFIDSTGLRLIVAADARAREAGRTLALIQGPPAVQRVFEITMLDMRLKIYPGRRRAFGVRTMHDPQSR